MLRYVGIRLASLVPILLGVSLLVFTLQHLVPGDIVDVAMGDALTADANAAARMRARLHLDRPLVEQYGLWIGAALHGDFGTSFASGKPVAREILRRLPVNIELATLAIAIALLVGIPVGTAAAVWHERWPDGAIRLGSVLGYSIPNFWVATLTVLVGALWLPGLPILRWVSITDDPLRNVTLALIPSFVLSLTVLPLVVRMTRAAVLENLRLDYVRTARSKGLGEPVVVFRHVLANSLLAVLNVTGVQLGVLLGGLVLTEEIFILPGVGRFLLDAIQRRDFPVVTGTTLFLATAFVAINLLVDLVHGVVDPRIRH